MHLLYVARVVFPTMQEFCFALLLKNGRFLRFAVLLDHLLVCLRAQAYKVNRVGCLSKGIRSLFLPLPRQVRDDLVDFI